jgi:hypothetical protein
MQQVSCFYIFEAYGDDLSDIQPGAAVVQQAINVRLGGGGGDGL